MSIDFWTLLDLENEESFNEFYGVMEDTLKPQISDILVSGYQNYLKDKLGTKFSQETVKDVLNEMFEEYRLISLL